MEKPQIEKAEIIDVDLKIEFSQEFDMERIRNTINKYDWFKKNGYWKNIVLPSNIKELCEIKKASLISEEEIRNAVESEYSEIKYKEKSDEINNSWLERKNDFIKKLSGLGAPINNEYNIYLTKYGTGGSYELPNHIVLNCVYNGVDDNLPTIFHEIIHISIEKLLIKNNFDPHGKDHWLKEGLVDMIQAKFYSEQSWRQLDLKNQEQINKIFSQYYPNIEKIILEISKL